MPEAIDDAAGRVPDHRVPASSGARLFAAAAGWHDGSSQRPVPGRPAVAGRDDNRDDANRIRRQSSAWKDLDQWTEHGPRTIVEANGRLDAIAGYMRLRPDDVAFRMAGNAAANVTRAAAFGMSTECRAGVRAEVNGLLREAAGLDRRLVQAQVIDPSGLKSLAVQAESIAVRALSLSMRIAPRCDEAADVEIERDCQAAIGRGLSLGQAIAGNITTDDHAVNPARNDVRAARLENFERTRAEPELSEAELYDNYQRPSDPGSISGAYQTMASMGMVTNYLHTNSAMQQNMSMQNSFNMGSWGQ